MGQKEQFDIYNSEPLLKRPLHLLEAVGKGLKEGYHLAWMLFLGHLQVMHKRFFIGILWEVVTPLFMAGVFLFLRAKSIVVLDSDNIPYAQYALTGIFFWQIFARSIFSTVLLTRGSLRLSTFLKVPAESLWLQAFFYSAFITVINISILTSILIFFFHISSINIAVASSFALALMILGINISFFVMPFGIIYNDIFRLLQLTVPILFILTPVVYSGSQSLTISSISEFNPIAILINAARHCMLGGESDLVTALLVGAGIFISVVPTLMYLRISKPYIVERVLA